MVVSILISSGIVWYIRSKPVAKQRLVDFIYHDIILLNLGSTIFLVGIALFLLYPK